ncbi:GPP34 family phosphoprotein [Streptomyces sp. TRM75563]|uniref:GOLPH3/VPS74 family protein n=1 Tax=Streptomyces sp. TRM75563 TaxID=2817418 RepID=UPI001F60CFD3|nr:GPP34 family phosphoprotein [Streptomyces sp. TRM75563]MCI4044873.1 GPP34 family phosphoprotein [Streptomyces sp. TRM75563]
MQKRNENEHIEYNEHDLLIVEDLTLLMMDDKSGAIAGEGTLYYTLGGAVLVELGLRGHIAADENDQGLNGVKVHAVSSRTPSDPLLRAAQAKAGERVRGVQTLLIEIGTGMRETVLDRLVERGMLRQETKKTLGLFRTTSTTVADTGYKKALVEKVRAVLIDGAEPDDRTAALTGLLSASGTLPTLHRSIPWSGQVYKRAKELEQSSWGAEAVNAAVMRTVAAISAGTVVAVTS